LVAAGVRFATDGYSATTIRSIAAAAGVSVPTIEAHFAGKARLLKAAIDVAIAGDDEPVAMLDRPFAERARAARSPHEVIRIVAEVVTPAQDRSAGLILAAFEAAPTDADLAALVTELVAQRRRTAAWIVDTLARTAALRVSRDESIETLWILMDPAVFQRAVRHLGWSLQRYRIWFAISAEHLLLPDY
jgi:AcrR family transcriptional regulator